MNINNKLINKSELARKIGLTHTELKNRMNCIIKSEFTPEQKKAIHDIFIELFCEIFEVDDIKFCDNSITGINLK